MDIQPLDLIIHAANFIIMMLALWLILWKPVSKYIKGRADRVKADREAAENEVKEAKTLRSEAEMKLQSVSRDAETLRREVKVEDNRALADEFFASLENGGTEKTKK